MTWKGLPSPLQAAIPLGVLQHVEPLQLLCAKWRQRRCCQHRSERLTDRKHELRRLLTGLPTSTLRYADHVEQHGTALFQRVCEMDLEGIVAKHAFGPYVADENGRHGSKSEIL